MWDSGKRETFCEGSKKEQSARKISRLRSKWRYGGMGLFHVVYNGYVWKTLFLYRYPERSRGIFPAHWYSALCETAEKGKPSAKGARKSRVQGRFLAALEMTVLEMDIPCILQRLCRESTLPVSSSEAKPATKAIYLFISIAHHAFLIIIYFSNLEYFR